MKILHTESSRGWGGQENRTLNECLGLRDRGHDVIVAAPPDARLLERAAQEGLRTAGIKMRSSLDPLAIFGLARLIRRERPAIISTHSGRDTTLAGLAARLAAPLLPRRPRIVRTRHLILPITSRTTYDGLPDQVAAVSQAVRDYLISAGVPAERVTAVPTGIRFERFDRAQTTSTLRAELGIAEDAVVVGTIAILRKRKGHQDLLAAAQRVFAAEPNRDIHFVFAGDGPQADNLRRANDDAGLASRVHLLGLRRDVPAVLKAFDLFVLPTHQEALGTSFIEAQAMGVPVIGTRVGGVPETMIENDSGLLVPVENPEALAEAILTLVRDPARRAAMGERGAGFVRERYSVDAMVEGMLALYERLDKAS